MSSQSENQDVLYKCNGCKCSQLPSFFGVKETTGITTGIRI